MSLFGSFKQDEELANLKKELQVFLDKKRTKESQLSPLLEKLFSFNIDINEWLILVELLGNESKRIRRYVHYFLECCHDQKVPLSDATVKSLTEIALADITNVNTTKAMHSIRTLAAITQKDDKDAPLSKAVSEIIRTSGLASSGEKKPEDLKTLKKRRSSKQLLSQVYLPSEAFWAVRSKFSSPDLNIMMAVIKGLNSKDRVTARHCSVLAYEFAKSEPEAIVASLKTIVGANNTITSKSGDGIEAASAGIHRDDETVRHYWVKICGLLGHAPDLPGYLPFKNELYDFLYDVSDRVAFIAIEEILRGSWEDICKAVVPDLQDQTKEAKVLTLIMNRLIGGLSSASTPTVHMAARISRLLAERHAYSLEEKTSSPQLGKVKNGHSLTRPSSSRKKVKAALNVITASPVSSDALKELEQKLIALLASSKSQSVRVQVLCTLVWITDESETKKLSDIIMKERNILPTNLIDVLLKELLKRAKNSSIFVETVLDLFYKLYCTVPSKLNSKLLTKTWRKVMKIGEHHRQKVLFNTFCFLETPHKRDTKQITINIQKVIFWFLGEAANTLTGDRCLPVSERDIVIGSQTDFIISSSMEAIISKLEQSVVHSPWETRLVCLEALAKIAFQSGITVRLRIYDFLLKCAKEDQLCIYHIAIHIIRALESLFNMRKRWVVVYEYGKKFKNIDEKKLFLNELESVKRNITPFCDTTDQNFLEPDLIEFYEANKKLRPKKRKKKQEEVSKPQKSK